MNKWALVSNGVVVETSTEDPTGRFHPDVEWIACGLDVGPGCIYSDGIFSIAAATELPLNQKELDTQLKWKGVEFEGVFCSATKEDQWGLNSLLLMYQMNPSGFHPTRFDFVNGSTLILTKENFHSFQKVWIAFRSSFFTVAA
jgi:hypothetical protein